MSEVKQKMNKDRNFKGDANKYLVYDAAILKSKTTRSMPKINLLSQSTTR